MRWVIIIETWYYWEPSGWDCYEVYSEGPDSIIWVATGSGTRYPARVVEGDQL